jgi:hypothetical protein
MAWKTRETKLLNAAEAKLVVPKSVRVSPDGRRFGYVLNKSGGQMVVIDGELLETVYQTVGDIRFSADGKDVAISGLVPRNDGALLPVVVLNGKRFSPKDGAPPAPELMAVDEGKVLYLCTTANNYCYFANDENIGVYKGPQPGWVVAEFKDRLKFARRDIHRTGLTPAGGLYRPGLLESDAKFSRDGSTWAAISQEGMDFSVVLNGEPTAKRFPSITGLIVGDGNHYGYIASRAETKKTYVVIDGRPVETPADTTGLVFNHDGTRWAANTRTTAIVDGSAHKSYQSILSRVAFSPDGKHTAYTAVRETVRKNLAGEDVVESHGVLVVDGQEVGVWPEAGKEIYWSTDNRTVATTARPEAGKPPAVVVNGRAWPAFDQTTPLGFSPDGRNFAAAVRHTEQAFVGIDGRTRGSYEEIGYDGSRVGFTPDGRMTYLARKGDNSIVWVEELRAGVPDAGPKVAAPKSSEWQPLFNGKDLTNWTFSEKSIEFRDRFVPPPNAVKWRVEDGAITFSGKDTSYLTAAGAPLENFHLRMELRTSPKARVRLGPIDTTHITIDNSRPERRTGSIFLGWPEKEGAIVADKLAADGEWCTLEVLAVGSRMATRVNGKRVAIVQTPAAASLSQMICVSTDYPSPIWVRKIEYRPLTDDRELDAPGELHKP